MAKKRGAGKHKGTLAIDPLRCAGCSYCRLNCPAEAIVIEDAIAHVTEACTLCGMCVWVCPVNAISLVHASCTPKGASRHMKAEY